MYCRISHTRDEDQTGVDRQERICRETAERLLLHVEAAHAYVDNNRSAWQRNRKRPGWEEMGDGEIRHVMRHGGVSGRFGFRLLRVGAGVRVPA
ncbi:hypothetical protein [Streptomyces massasporeus]|uniref:hypothetical protein n=1 Tax=Streptomyces massasporeus TaxID=67324 RepID=UPI0033238478